MIPAHRYGWGTNRAAHGATGVCEDICDGSTCWPPSQSSFAPDQPNLTFLLQVTVNNEESDESFESSWSYMQSIQSSALWGHDRRKFHKTVTESRVRTGCPWSSFSSLLLSQVTPADVCFRLTG